MGLSSFQNAAEANFTPYSDNTESSPNCIPHIFITPPSTPPPYNSAITTSPNQSSISPYHALSVPPSLSDLEKGLPPSYLPYTAYSTYDPTPLFPINQNTPNQTQNHNQLIVLLPNETSHLYLSTTSPSSTASSDQNVYPSWFQILSFVHISAALLTGIEVLDLLYLHHVEEYDVLGAGVFGGPLMLLWALLGAYFGSGAALCFV